MVEQSGSIWVISSRILFLCLAVCCICGPLHANGQATVGSIVGDITDNSGAKVPNVDVTVTNQDTGAVRDVHADSHGTYSVTNLEPGTYRVSAKASGFREVDHMDVVLNSQA